MKQYRLLRDNKETGPYAAEELIQMGLKKYDLVWVEGRSAAWRYPCEIDVFKPYAPAVDENPFDRFYKKPSANNVQQPVTTVTTAEMPVAAAEVVKKEKPRFRIKADARQIETTTTTAVPEIQSQPVVQPLPQTQPVYQPYAEPKASKAQPVQPTTASASWESMWMDWEQEKKAVSDASVSYKTVNDRIKAIGEEEVLETKFSQSIDDIAGKYADSLLVKKRSSGNFEKYKSHLTAAVLLIAILAAGMWVGLKWSDKTGYNEAKNNNQPQQDIQLIPSEATNNSATEDNAVNENATSTQQEENTETSPVDNTSKQSVVTAVVQKNTKPAVISSKPKIVTPVKNAPVNTQQKNNNAVAKSTQKSNTPVQKNYQPSATISGIRGSVKRDDVDNSSKDPVMQEPVANNEVKRTAKKAPAIDDYIDVESYPIATGVQYNVSNISDVPLDLVVLDLQYFDSNGRFIKGETLTVKNIEAGNSISVNAPQNAKAAGIKYKVSMISSSQNDLNIIAD